MELTQAPSPPTKAATFLDEETSFQGRYSKQVFQTLKLSYQPFLGQIAAATGLGFIGRILLLGNANVIGIWVDSFCRAPAPCRPLPHFFQGFAAKDFLLVLSAMTLFGFFTTLVFRISFSRLSARAISGLYDEVTLRTSRFPIRFFDNNPVGRVVTRFSSDYNNVFRLFGGPLAEFISIIFDLLCMIILVTIASPLYVPVIALIALANWAVYRLNRDRLRVERRALSASRSPSIAHFAETAQGASTIRVFARQSTFARRFARLNLNYLNQRLATSVVVLRFSLQMSLITSSLLLFTGATGHFLVTRGYLSIGSVGVAFTFVVLSGASLQMFFEWLAQVEEAMTGVERLNEYLRRPVEPGARLPSWREYETDHLVYADNDEMRLKGEKLIEASSARVSIQDLWFRYSADLPFVLKGLKIEIEPGEKIGVIGRTGSGKTSFVQALFRLYPLERGRIEINGLSADAVDLVQYRKSIALISQEPTLFKGTLRENLSLDGRQSDQQLRLALGRVGLSHWLESQVLGLEMLIEERGRNLSAGERQLLCMARCLLQDAPVVVMDEATSSIDPQSEEILVRATHEFFADRTQIIIAHRLSTLEHCDRVIWLSKGEIKMFGTPAEVIPVFRQTQLD
jgi:ABC-type multidrug transport system fused ATPase/permease subunit